MYIIITKNSHNTTYIIYSRYAIFVALGPEEKFSTIKRIHYDVYYHRVYYVDRFVQMIVYCCAPYEYAPLLTCV